MSSASEQFQLRHTLTNIYPRGTSVHSMDSWKGTVLVLSIVLSCKPADGTCLERLGLCTASMTSPEGYKGLFVSACHPVSAIDQISNDARTATRQRRPESSPLAIGNGSSSQIHGLATQQEQSLSHVNSGLAAIPGRARAVRPLRRLPMAYDRDRRAAL